jgi:hypothetical protein
VGQIGAVASRKTRESETFGYSPVWKDVAVALDDLSTLLMIWIRWGTGRGKKNEPWEFRRY